jgi:hypothetical protein
MSGWENLQSHKAEHFQRAFADAPSEILRINHSCPFKLQVSISDFTVEDPSIWRFYPLLLDTDTDGDPDSDSDERPAN